MSVAHYLQLRAELRDVRSRAHDSPEEDRVLGEMDDAWWSLTNAERELIRVLLTAAKASVTSHPLAQSPAPDWKTITRGSRRATAHVVASVAGSSLRAARIAVGVSAQP
jgi:hypothetical protein